MPEKRSNGLAAGWEKREHAASMGLTTLGGDHEMRMTRQRQAILDVLRETKSHPSVEWVFAQVRERLPQVSLATVYRNLHQLAAVGMIQRLSVGGGVSRFDADTTVHYHVRCLQCGRIDDLNVPPQEALLETARRRTAFRLVTHHVEFLGLCPNCEDGDRVRAERE
jgi:Fe2+ or Zn2+ uptake regulation protein